MGAFRALSFRSIVHYRRHYLSGWILVRHVLIRVHNLDARIARISFRPLAVNIFGWANFSQTVDVVIVAAGCSLRFSGKSASVGRHLFAICNRWHWVPDVKSCVCGGGEGHWLLGFWFYVRHVCVSRLFGLRQIDIFDLTKVELSACLRLAVLEILQGFPDLREPGVILYLVWIVVFFRCLFLLWLLRSLALTTFVRAQINFAWETCTTNVLSMFIINHYLPSAWALWGASIIHRSEKYLVSTLEICSEVFCVRCSADPASFRLYNLQLIFKYLEIIWTLVVMKLEDMV